MRALDVLPGVTGPRAGLRLVSRDQTARLPADAPTRGAVMDPFLGFRTWPGERGTFRGGPVEAPLAEFDKYEVDGNHHHEDGQEAGGQRGEAEEVSEWGVRE